jgi:hypothetical protein
MNRRSDPTAETVNIEKFLISNYVRLCIAEGIKPKDAYKQLKRRLRAVEELKDPRTPQ